MATGGPMWTQEEDAALLQALLLSDTSERRMQAAMLAMPWRSRDAIRRRAQVVRSGGFSGRARPGQSARHKRMNEGVTGEPIGEHDTDRDHWAERNAKLLRQLSEYHPHGAGELSMP